ncbi:MAG: NAD(P)/FAD-dependent oxidoreductase [Lachnospiraceae bacterium]|nr:NAD(P)/FAD-dependent oxidoreductase [Lachnospiraceae bacterium]
MYDIIIIGAGPAGISAAIYAKRAGTNVLVLDNDNSELIKAHKIDNYYGFPEGISGSTLYDNGIQQAKNLEIDLKKEAVLNIKMNENMCYDVKTSDNIYTSDSVIFATGTKKAKPLIKGLNEFEGKGISYCAICDGFFYRKKDVVIIGDGDYALSEASDLVNIVNSITILTNGKEPGFENCNYKVDKRPITSINGDMKVEEIEFSDGSTLKTDGIFIAIGSAGASDFAKKMGIMTNNDNIKVNEHMETNIKGVYACGNITGGLLQVNKAVYEGAVAGLSAANYIKAKRKGA